MQSLASLQHRRPGRGAPLATTGCASCIPRAGAISTPCARNCTGTKEDPEHEPCRRIALRDFVIVRELELDLSTGFTVLTGETGAGKSILIDALQLALGNRADAGAVREGAERLDVSAEFDRRPGAGRLAATKAASRPATPCCCAAPSTCQGTQPRLDQRQPRHGHATARTRRPPARHPRPARLAKPDAARRRARPARCLRRRRHRRARQQPGTPGGRRSRRWTTARSAQDSLQRERERLQWQIGEVDEARARRRRVGRAVGQPHARCRNAQALIDAAEGARERARRRRRRRAGRAERAPSTLLQDCEHIEPEFKALGEVLASSVAQAADAAHSLHGYLRQADTDPETLAELDERMGLWMSLARRYKRHARRTAGAAGRLAGRTAGARCRRATSTRWSAPSKRRSRPT